MEIARRGDPTQQLTQQPDLQFTQTAISTANPAGHGRRKQLKEVRSGLIVCNAGGF
jgi:hypothetical protein